MNLFENTEYSKLIDEVASGSLFNGSEVAEPVPDLLPHRGTPYPSLDNPLGKFSNPTPSANPYSPKFSEDDIEIMAEYELDMMMAKTDMATELARGALSAIVATREDIERLERHQSGFDKMNEYDLQKVIERVELKKAFENQNPQNVERERQLLKKVIKYDLQKQAANGSLNMPSMTKMVYQILTNRLMFISGKHPKVFSVLGKTFFSKLTAKFF
jgi:hypothetical protein